MAKEPDARGDDCEGEERPDVDDASLSGGRGDGSREREAEDLLERRVQVPRPADRDARTVNSSTRSQPITNAKNSPSVQ